MIKFRGAVELSLDVVSEADLTSYLLAQPHTPTGVPAKKPHEAFKWLKEGERVLVPRYSDLVRDLVKRTDKKEFKLTEPNTLGKPDSFFRWNSKFPLREKQVPGAERAEAILRKRRGAIIKGDTGSGKTVVGLNMIYRLQPQSVLILVDQIDIAAQWAERISQFMPGAWPNFLMQDKDVREIRKKLTKPKSAVPGNIIIATAQSLYRSATYTHHSPIEVDLLICDEVHVFSAPTFLSSIFKVNFGYSIGLTATDDRNDRLDWLFRDALGRSTVQFEGEVMEPIIYKLKAPSAGFRDDQWRMAWCGRFHEMTWAAKCKSCIHADRFPFKCGGNLPASMTGKVKWDGMQNRSGLIAAWSTSDEYQTWLRGVIDHQMKKGRNIFVFGDGRKFLIMLYIWAKEQYGGEQVGLFLGKGKADPDEPDFRAQRKTALQKRLTFCTYGVARKALDVREKDCQILGTPISDARQAVGRVRRTADNKKQPVVIVPVPSRIGTFNGAWMKIRKWFVEQGWTIKQ